jgi:hypothetical protein
MEYENRLKRFFKGTSYSFDNSHVRGVFVVKNFKIKKLPYVIYHTNGKSDCVLDLTIDLKKCEYFAIGGFWFEPEIGFRKHKIKINKVLKSVIENEVQVKLNFLSIDYTIDKIKINWLHEPIERECNNQVLS